MGLSQWLLLIQTALRPPPFEVVHPCIHFLLGIIEWSSPHALVQPQSSLLRRPFLSFTNSLHPDIRSLSVRENFFHARCSGVEIFTWLYLSFALSAFVSSMVVDLWLEELGYLLIFNIFALLTSISFAVLYWGFESSLFVYKISRVADKQRGTIVSNYSIQGRPSS